MLYILYIILKYYTLHVWYFYGTILPHYAESAIKSKTNKQQHALCDYYYYYYYYHNCGDLSDAITQNIRSESRSQGRVMYLQSLTLNVLWIFIKGKRLVWTVKPRTEHQLKVCKILLFSLTWPSAIFSVLLETFSHLSCAFSLVYCWSWSFLCFHSQ